MVALKLNKRVSAAVLSGLTVASFGAITSYAGTVTVQPGDTVWRIGQAQHVSESAIETANPTVNPLNLQIGQVLQLPNQGPSVAPTTTYLIQPGDTVWKIGKRKGVSVSSILNANPAMDPSNLQIGSQLMLPIATSTPATNSTQVASSTATSQSTQSQASATSSSDLYWLEHVINAEAGGESLQAQIAVGDVIIHRIANGSYGSNVHDVVFQISSGHYQFSSVPNGYIYTTPNASSIQAANDVLNNKQDIVPGALVFYNPSQTPAGSWVWSQPTIAQYGNLVFAK